MMHGALFKRDPNFKPVKRGTSLHRDQVVREMGISLAVSDGTYL